MVALCQFSALTKTFLTVKIQADLEMYSVDNQWWINDTSLQEIWNELTHITT